MARTKPQNRPKVVRRPATATPTAGIPDPSAGLPAEVVVYLDSVVSARNEDIMPDRPPAGIFHYILTHWLRFDGNPHGPNATRMSLGREWRAAATEWWMNEMRRDFEAGIPQAVALVARLVTMSTAAEAEEAGVPWEQVEEAKKLLAAKVLLDMSRSGAPMRSSGCVPAAAKPKRGPGRPRKTIVQQPTPPEGAEEASKVVDKALPPHEQPRRPKRKVVAPTYDNIEPPKRQKRQAATSATEVAPLNSPKRKAETSAEDFREVSKIQDAGEAIDTNDADRDKENEDPNSLRSHKKRRVVSDDSVVAAWSHLQTSPPQSVAEEADDLPFPASAQESSSEDSDKDIWEVPQKSPKKARTMTKPAPRLKLKVPATVATAAADQVQAEEDTPVSQVKEAQPPKKIVRLQIGTDAAHALSTRTPATKQAQSNSGRIDGDSTPGSVNKKRYFGSWRHAITGPSKDDKAALTPPVTKNKSSNPADKVWECTHHPEPLPRKKLLRAGLDLDDPDTLSELLTLRFELKSDPATKLVYQYDPPSDWDDQFEITSLVKVITQHRRREAGAKSETRHAYTVQEIAWLTNYFDDHKSLQGEKGMQPVKKWESVAAAFNTKFRGREVRIASKGDEVETVGDRSWHAIMALSERNEDILKARKCSTKRKSLKGGKAGALGGEGEEAGASVVPPTPAPKKTHRQSAKAK